MNNDVLSIIKNHIESQSKDMNDVLLSGNNYCVQYPKSEDYPDGKQYVVSLVDNQRNYEVRLNGKLIYRNGACWATYYEVKNIIGDN